MKFTPVLLTLAAVVVASPWNSPQGTAPCSTSCKTEVETESTVIYVPTTKSSQTTICKTTEVPSEKTTVVVETHTTVVYKPVTMTYVPRNSMVF